MQSGDLQQVINCYNIDLGVPTVIFLSCLVQSTLFQVLGRIPGKLLISPAKAFISA